jgi:hypothetical protein
VAESLTTELHETEKLLHEAHKSVCSLLCPSTGKAGEPIGHCDLCDRIAHRLTGRAIKTSPINAIHLSTCGQFVECWNNGSKVQSIYIGGQDSGNYRAAVAVGQKYFRDWTGCDASVSRELSSKMGA